MQLVELLNLANEHYDDGYLAAYYDERTGVLKEGHGDTLAKFIVVEIAETFQPSMSDHDQVQEAIWAMEDAQRQLSNVMLGLEGNL